MWYPFYSLSPCTLLHHSNITVLVNGPTHWPCPLCTISPRNVPNWTYHHYLTCLEIALSPPLINRNSVQNYLNYPTEPQTIADSCHNNSLPLAYLLLKTLATPIHWPPNPSSLPTSNHRLYAYCSSITGPANVISLYPTQFPCILTPIRPVHLYEDQLLTTLIGFLTT